MAMAKRTVDRAGRMALSNHYSKYSVDCVDCVEKTNMLKQSWRREWFEMVDRCGQLNGCNAFQLGVRRGAWSFGGTANWLSRFSSRLFVASRPNPRAVQQLCQLCTAPCCVDLQIDVPGLECTDLIFAVDTWQEIEEIGQTMPKCKVEKLWQVAAWIVRADFVQDSVSAKAWVLRVSTWISKPAGMSSDCKVIN